MTMSRTVTVYHRDGREKEMDANEAARLVGCGQRGLDEDWSFVKPPPLNWEFETPRYRATRDVLPAPLARFRHEPPHAENYDGCWQYGTQLVKRGDEVETTFWPPHGGFEPINFAAEKVLAFFRAGMKSRMTQSPWYDGRVRLENGLSNAPGIVSRPPQPAPFNSRPAA